jgi:hypothetical protein
VSSHEIVEENVGPAQATSLVVHLSDLHIARDAQRQAVLFEKLVKTVALEQAAVTRDRTLLAITGDVFDSATDPASELVHGFLELHRRIVDALGGDVPTVVLPGNHDRRRLGLLGPPRESLFRSLRDAVDSRTVYVAGCRGPFLAEIVPSAFHGLPAHVIAYDSSYLPHGLVGAGGTLRIEDLLQAHASLPRDGRPVLLLIHHHPPHSDAHDRREPRRFGRRASPGQMARGYGTAGAGFECGSRGANDDRARRGHGAFDAAFLRACRSPASWSQARADGAVALRHDAHLRRRPARIGGERGTARGPERARSSGSRAPVAVVQSRRDLRCRGARRIRFVLAQTIECNDDTISAPFASITDLTTGRESPADVHADDGTWTVTADACPPRTLLRIYWPLAE